MFDPTLIDPHSRIDRLQLAALCGLMLLGTAFVYSATMVTAAANAAAWYNQIWVHQIIWYAIGAGAGAALCLVDYRTLTRWSYVIYWFAILLLVAVLVIGNTHGWGARRWIDLGPFNFQPSEFAKLAFILAEAHFLSRPVEELREPLIFLKALGLMLLPVTFNGIIHGPGFQILRLVEE